MKTIWLILFILSTSVKSEFFNNSKFAMKISAAHPSVQKLFHKIKTYESLAPSCECIDDCPVIFKDGTEIENEKLREHKKKYSLEISKDKFFNAFNDFHPSQIWTKDSKFELAYRMSTDELFGVNDKEYRVMEGDILFLSLKIKMKRLLSLKLMEIPVAFKIMKVDPNNNEISFSYIKENETKGMQHLSISEKSDDTIEIVHLTRFTSRKNIRDSLYPAFHHNLINDFYKTIERLYITKN